MQSNKVLITLQAAKRFFRHCC